MSEALLRAEGLVRHYGGVRAVDGVDLEVRADEIVSIIGPNGAGKTTLFDLVSRKVTPEAGRLEFLGQDLLRRRPHQLAGLGLTRTFQNLELFDEASVLENLLLTQHHRRRTGLVRQLLFTPAVRQQERALREHAEDVLDLLDLQRDRHTRVRELPYGRRKAVELARAVATGPRLLLLDEPAAGLNPEETEDLRHQLRDLRQLCGIALLLVEHDLSLVAELSDRVVALVEGKVVAEGTAGQVRAHPEVIRAYLGREEQGDPPRDRERDPQRGRDRVADPLLRIENLETDYGPIQALRGVSMDVSEGGITVLLGANGAGKTTVLRTICGLLEARAGSVQFAGQPILGREPDAIARSGLGHVPEGREIFPSLSVDEHLRLSAFARTDSSPVEPDEIYALFPPLGERRRQKALTLSGGEQQMLALGRALLGRPRLLLLDEPSLGLAPRHVEEVFEALRRLPAELGTTLLLVEQNARQALAIADEGAVLDGGRVVLAGSRKRLLDDEDLQEFYLGRKAASQLSTRRWKRRKRWS